VLVAVGVVLALYALFIVVLLATGRRSEARAVAGFIPDCLVLFRALLGDPRVSTARKVLVAVMVAYLAMPFDLVPDFLPVVGQLDDALIVVLVLRSVLRGGGPELIRDHWRGPQRSLDLMLRLAYGSRDAAA